MLLPWLPTLVNQPSGWSRKGRSHTACGTLPRTRRRRTPRSPMCTAWPSVPTVFGSPSEISDVNDLLDANESTRVFVALGDCSVGSICVERIERERHLARPVGEYRSVGEKPCRTTSAGTPKGGTRERLWRVEALPNTHENFTGGATFVDRSDSRGSLFYRELRIDDRVQDT